MKKESFDVVDTQDRIIGEAFRHEVHGNPNLIHRVVHVLIFNSQNELYLQKRSAAKDMHPGKWDTSVGGHVDKGESYQSAAVREMAEELGIRQARLYHVYKYLHRNHHESEYVSTYHCLWDGPIAIHPEEIEILDEITRYQEFIKNA